MSSRRKERQLRIHQRGLDTIRLMRAEGHSLTKAAKLSHTDPRTVLKQFPQLFSKSTSGRIRVTPGDRLVGYMYFMTPDGLINGAIRGSGNRDLVAEHARAVRYFNRHNDRSRLKKFRGKSMLVSGVRREFVTDPATLKRLDAAGEASYEDLYVYSS